MVNTASFRQIQNIDQFHSSQQNHTYTQQPSDQISKRVNTGNGELAVQRDLQNKFQSNQKITSTFTQNKNSFNQMQSNSEKAQMLQKNTPLTAVQLFQQQNKFLFNNHSDQNDLKLVIYDENSNKQIFQQSKSPITDSKLDKKILQAGSNLKQTFIGKELLHNLAPLVENISQSGFQNLQQINYNRQMISEKDLSNSFRLIQQQILKKQSSSNSKLNQEYSSSDVRNFQEGQSRSYRQIKQIKIGHEIELEKEIETQRKKQDNLNYINSFRGLTNVAAQSINLINSQKSNLNLLQSQEKIIDQKLESINQVNKLNFGFLPSTNQKQFESKPTLNRNQTSTQLLSKNSQINSYSQKQSTSVEQIVMPSIYRVDKQFQDIQNDKKNIQKYHDVQQDLQKTHKIINQQNYQNLIQSHIYDENSTDSKQSGFDKIYDQINHKIKNQQILNKIQEKSQVRHGNFDNDQISYERNWSIIKSLNAANQKPQDQKYKMQINSKKQNLEELNLSINPSPIKNKQESIPTFPSQYTQNINNFYYFNNLNPSFDCNQNLIITNQTQEIQNINNIIIPAKNIQLFLQGSTNNSQKIQTKPSENQSQQLNQLNKNQLSSKKSLISQQNYSQQAIESQNIYKQQNHNDSYLNNNSHIQSSQKLMTLQNNKQEHIQQQLKQNNQSQFKQIYNKTKSIRQSFSLNSNAMSNEQHQENQLNNLNSKVVKSSLNEQNEKNKILAQQQSISSLNIVGIQKQQQNKYQQINENVQKEINLQQVQPQNKQIPVVQYDFEQYIIINVFDENRNLNRQFKCKKDILQNQMKYFDPFFKKNDFSNKKIKNQDIDITVHCDIKIFDWLVKYMNYKQFIDEQNGKIILQNSQNPQTELKAKADSHPQKKQIFETFNINTLNSMIANFVAKHVKYQKKTNEQNSIQNEQSTNINKNTEKSENTQPILDLKNVISVLLSSDFLQMETLVKECISYIVCNLQDVVRLPIDMNCLSDKLLWQISMKTPFYQIYTLQDKRDKLMSRIFYSKLFQMFQLIKFQNKLNLANQIFLPHQQQDFSIRRLFQQNQMNEFLWQEPLSDELIKQQQSLDGIDIFQEKFENYDQQIQQYFAELKKKVISEDNESNLSNIISYCCQCKQLYQVGSYINCTKAKVKIDFYGRLQFNHTPQKNFNLKDYFEFMVQELKISWKTIFMQAWILLQDMKCKDCGQFFNGYEMNKCKFHESPPQFHSSSINFGIYPCCFKAASRFHITNIDGCQSMSLYPNYQMDGCKEKYHVPSEEYTPTKQLYQIKEYLYNEFNKINNIAPNLNNIQELYNQNYQQIISQIALQKALDQYILIIQKKGLKKSQIMKHKKQINQLKKQKNPFSLITPVKIMKPKNEQEQQISQANIQNSQTAIQQHSQNNQINTQSQKKIINGSSIITSQFQTGILVKENVLKGKYKRKSNKNNVVQSNPGHQAQQHENIIQNSHIKSQDQIQSEYKILTPDNKIQTEQTNHNYKIPENKKQIQDTKQTIQKHKKEKQNSLNSISDKQETSNYEVSDSSFYQESSEQDDAEIFNSNRDQDSQNEEEEYENNEQDLNEEVINNKNKSAILSNQQQKTNQKYLDADIVDSNVDQNHQKIDPNGKMVYQKSIQHNNAKPVVFKLQDTDNIYSNQPKINYKSDNKGNKDQQNEFKFDFAEQMHNFKMQNKQKQLKNTMFLQEQRKKRLQFQFQQENEQYQWYQSEKPSFLNCILSSMNGQKINQYQNKNQIEE